MKLKIETKHSFQTNIPRVPFGIFFIQEALFPVPEAFRAVGSSGAGKHRLTFWSTISRPHLSMAEGYDCTGKGDCSPSWLDELLCEYVDGTMDRAVRAAFEECLRADPLLAKQVEQLRCTRTLLCRHGCHVPDPDALQARIQRRLAAERLYPQSPYFPEAASRLSAFAAAGSVVAAAVMIGLLVGAAWLAQQPTAEIADQAPRQHNALEDLQPAAAMTPLQGPIPQGLPTFLGEPAATPLLLTPSSSHLPNSFLYYQQQGAALQRTGGAP